MSIFQQKYFNEEAWGSYLDYLLLLKPSELILSGAVSGNARVAQAMASQTGTLTATLPYYSDGTEDTSTQAYDGVSDIVPVKPQTYAQTFGATGFTKSWFETDFSIDLTTAESVNFIYGRLANWRRYAVEQPLVLSILNGLFTANPNQTAKTDFITAHSQTLSAITPTSLNDALDAAAGHHKKNLTMFVCHSHLATQLENLQLLDYIKYTAPSGLQTSTTLATWNGRLLLIDDDINQGTPAGSYVGYALGAGALMLQELPVKIPIEPNRDPFKAGGQDSLIIRNRYAFGAKGFSFVPTPGQNHYSMSDLVDGEAWQLIEDTSGGVIPHKEIPIAKITYTPAP